MADVILKLHPFADLASAAKVADDIRNSGTVNYTDNTGATVTVNVGDVSVEDGSLFLPSRNYGIWS